MVTKKDAFTVGGLTAGALVVAGETVGVPNEATAALIAGTTAGASTLALEEANHYLEKEEKPQSTKQTFAEKIALERSQKNAPRSL